MNNNNNKWGAALVLWWWWWAPVLLLAAFAAVPSLGSNYYRNRTTTSSTVVVGKNGDSTTWWVTQTQAKVWDGTPWRGALSFTCPFVAGWADMLFWTDAYLYLLVNSTETPITPIPLPLVSNVRTTKTVKIVNPTNNGTDNRA